MKKTTTKLTETQRLKKVEDFLEEIRKEGVKESSYTITNYAVTALALLQPITKTGMDAFEKLGITDPHERQRLLG